MLQNFFEMESGGKEYFQNLNIWKCGETYTRHCEAYPVISLSLKDVKGDAGESGDGPEDRDRRYDLPESGQNRVHEFAADFV